MLMLACVGCHDYFAELEVAKEHEADCNARPGWPHAYRIEGTPAVGGEDRVMTEGEVL